MSSLWRTTTQGAVGVAAAVVRWWWGELTALCPPKLASLLNKDQRVIIKPDVRASFAEVYTADRQARLRLSIPFDERSYRQVAKLLDGRRPQVGLALGAEDLFQRSFVMPVAARRNLQAILDQDLIHKTPFGANDVVQGAVLETAGGDGNRLRVTHVIVRKDKVQNILTAVGWASDAIDFLHIETANDHSAQIDLRPPRAVSGWRRFSLLKAGAASACVMVVIAILAFYVRQDGELDLVTHLASRTRPQAEAAQASMKRREKYSEAIETLVSKKKAIGVTEALEAVTKVLPDDTWVQGLKITGSDDGLLEIALRGYSGNAANLVSLFERSGSFADAQLTSAIVPDSLEHKERFSIKAILRREPSVAKRGSL